MNNYIVVNLSKLINYRVRTLKSVYESTVHAGLTEEKAISLCKLLNMHNAGEYGYINGFHSARYTRTHAIIVN